MNYFLDRLNTLNPRLKRSPLAALLISKLTTIYRIATQAQGRPPSQSEVIEMRDLANEMEAAAMSKIDDKEHLLDIRE
jgi:hypothetical protein